MKRHLGIARCGLACCLCSENTDVYGHENHYSELFKKADIAMYKAKADPENRFYIYE